MSHRVRGKARTLQPRSYKRRTQSLALPNGQRDSKGMARERMAGTGWLVVTASKGRYTRGRSRLLVSNSALDWLLHFYSHCPFRSCNLCPQSTASHSACSRVAQSVPSSSLDGILASVKPKPMLFYFIHTVGRFASPHSPPVRYL